MFIVDFFVTNLGLSLTLLSDLIKKVNYHRISKMNIPLKSMYNCLGLVENSNSQTIIGVLILKLPHRILVFQNMVCLLALHLILKNL